MTDDSVVADTGTKGAAGQVVTALVLVGGAIALVWGLGGVGDSPARDEKPAACNAPKETDAPEYPALCAALNRPDLPTLLGTPTEHVSVAQSGGGPFTFPDGTKMYDASAQVQLGPVNVRITDNRNLSVQDVASFAKPPALPTSVLGRPAATYADHTMAIAFSTNGKSTSGPGGIARHLVVAKDPKAGGGSFELTIWRQDTALPDETALFRIAEQVLPTVRGWVAGTA
ncbi:hypothetical protein J5Y04_37500 [Kitasatospora sp. RG8]|uniref:DUF6215 domain-containing protein n=1 Tax=Kitasatospora sp. RG8 TaxID=2820815 RepID=UPI001ADFE0B0|nr:DUF6215 domain-containing protein [Kitasatospora sp. RG8]MBP0455170.1 hypothetical protein [Kitasatospora sp. RG8]